MIILSEDFIHDVLYIRLNLTFDNNGFVSKLMVLCRTECFLRIITPILMLHLFFLLFISSIYSFYYMTLSFVDVFIFYSYVLCLVYLESYILRSSLLSSIIYFFQIFNIKNLVLYILISIMKYW